MKRIAIGFVLLAAIGGAAYWAWVHNDELPEGLVQTTGRVEGDEITIAADISGRIVEMTAREGDPVEAGQVLVRLDDRAVRARLTQAEKAVAAAEAGLRRARAEQAAARAGLKAAEKSLDVLREEVPLKVEKAEAELERARAAYVTAEAAEERFRRDYERNRELRQAKAISQEDFEASQLAWVEAQNAMHQARAEARAAEQDRADALLGERRVAAQESEVERLRAEVSRAEAAIDEAEARRDEAEAAVEEAQSVLEDLTVVAPAPGTIITRIAESGEVIVAGAPLYDMVDLDRLYLKAYIPQQEVGRLSLGDPARIYTDAFPDVPYPATLGHVARRAEFTPREVQTPEQRVKLVFAVKLFLEENPEHRLTPGLPADAVIRWKEDVEWEKPRW